MKSHLKIVHVLLPFKMLIIYKFRLKNVTKLHSLSWSKDHVEGLIIAICWPSLNSEKNEIFQERISSRFSTFLSRPPFFSRNQKKGLRKNCRLLYVI